MESIKATVARRFLKFVAMYVPLKQARLATLGGQGIEAKLWKEEGIPPDHGWLIEHSRVRSRNLILNHRYKTCNRLGTFHRILGGHSDRNASVDGFHLDLCGTMRPDVVNDFCPALPLVWNSTGKCLAITVADQRRNTALEQWPVLMKRSRTLFGKSVPTLFGELEVQQARIPVRTDLPAFMKGFDPNKGAKREFWLLVEMAQLLRGSEWSPETIERYVYVSRYQDRPFRMRTYFLHFGQNDSSDRGLDLARLWMKSPLYFSSGADFTLINTDASTRLLESAPKRGDVKMSRLEELVKVLGGEYFAEFQKLQNGSAQLEKIQQTLGDLGIAAQPATATPLPTPLKHGRRNWEDLTPQEQIAWAIKTLELRATSNGSWDNGVWKKLLREDFGHYSTKLGKSLRAALARTNGKFRPHFVGRIKTVFGTDAQPYLERLSKL